jgi:hypothetical protein
LFTGSLLAFTAKLRELRFPFGELLRVPVHLLPKAACVPFSATTFVVFSRQANNAD